MEKGDSKWQLATPTLISEHVFSSNELKSDNNEVLLFSLMRYSFAEDAFLSVPRWAEGQAALTKTALETRTVTQPIRTHKVIIKHWPFPRLDTWGWICGTAFISFSKRNASVK